MSRTSLSFAVLLALSTSPALQAASSDPLAKQQAALGATDGTRLYYVRHTRGLDADARRQLSGLGGEVREHFERIGAYLVALPAAGAQTVAAQVQLGGASPLAAIEAVPEYRMLEQVVPWNVDQFQARQVWDHDRDGAIDGGAPDLSQVKVCVIDSGLHREHSDFAGIAISGEGEGPVGDWFVDGSGHGTHVAGTINAANNQRGVVGVLPGSAALHIVKVFNNSGSWGGGSLASAVRKCRDAGAHVINMSLGSGATSSTEQAMLQDVYDTHGILSIAAAGNDGDSTRSYPASYPSVISVGAIDHERELAAEFSQTPPSSHDPANPPANSEWDTVELAGGGVQVLSTVPGPNGEVPNYFAQAGGETFHGSRVSAQTEPQPSETMPEGDVSGLLVDGGRCLAGSGVPAWADAIVLCERGDVPFAEKVNEVFAQHGAAVVIYNNIPGDLAATCAGNCTEPSLPALALSQTKGQALRAAVGQSGRVVIDAGTGCDDCSGGYEVMSGTSMSSPGVAGAAALLWNACGGPAGLDNKTLRRLLRDTAKDLQGEQPGQAIAYGAGPDRVTGWGLPQIADAIELGGAEFGLNCSLSLEITPASAEVCSVQTGSVPFTATLGERFQGSATLAVAGVPAGSSGSFALNPVVHPLKTSVYTLEGLAQAPAGLHVLRFGAQDDSDAGIVSHADAHLTVVHAAPAATSAQSPAEGAIDVSPLTTLRWQAVEHARDYQVEVAADAAFAEIVFSATTNQPAATTTLLAPATRHWWRVRARNACGDSAVSVSASFVTGQTRSQTFCATPNAAIPDGNPVGVNTQIVVPPDSGTLLDLDLRLEATHTWTGDLLARLERSGGPAITLFDRVGYPVAGFGCAANNPGLTLDDEGLDGSAEAQCAAGNHATAFDPIARYTPHTPLANFDGIAFAGNWTLNVSDVLPGDAGRVTRWCLEAITSGSGEGNVPPQFASDGYAFALGADSAAGTAIGTLAASDADDATLSFAIVAGNDAGLFALDPASGALTIADPTAAPPGDSLHRLQVQVSDGRGGSATIEVVVRLLSADGRILRDGFEG